MCSVMNIAKILRNAGLVHFSTSLSKIPPPTNYVLKLHIQPVLYKLVVILGRISRRGDTWQGCVCITLCMCNMRRLGVTGSELPLFVGVQQPRHCHQEATAGSSLLTNFTVTSSVNNGDDMTISFVLHPPLSWW
ncbi:hypothetical protein DMENIID0001_063880 [Sergentomyia squamirostris]